MTGDPGVDQVALAAGAFGAKCAGMDIFAFLYQCYPQAIGNGPGVVRLKVAPNGEQDTPFFFRVDLHAEVADAEAVGHKERADPVLTFGDGHLGVEPLDVKSVGDGIIEVYGGAAAAPVKEIILIIRYIGYLPSGRAGEEETLEMDAGRPNNEGDVSGIADRPGAGGVSVRLIAGDMYVMRAAVLCDVYCGISAGGSEEPDVKGTGVRDTEPYGYFIGVAPGVAAERDGVDGLPGEVGDGGQK